MNRAITSRFFPGSDSKQEQANMDSKLKSIKFSWMFIFFCSIAAAVSLIFVLYQREVFFLDKEEWENDDDVALVRACFIAILTIVISLLSSSYGFWRGCITSHLLTADQISSSFIAANGALCLCSFIMFISFEVSPNLIIAINRVISKLYN